MFLEDKISRNNDDNKQNDNQASKSQQINLK